MQRLIKLGRSICTRVALPSMLMMFASTLPAMAEDVYQLLVKMNNDEQKAFLLSKKPVVSFTDIECVIDYEAYKSYFDMGNVKDITITTAPAGVKEVASEAITLDYTDPNRVVVRGVPAGALVTLHTLSGIMLDSVRADADGNAQINMSAVNPSSVCILSVNSTKNFKIYKK